MPDYDDLKHVLIGFLAGALTVLVALLAVGRV
jgi:hypothetical protein